MANNAENAPRRIVGDSLPEDVIYCSYLPFLAFVAFLVRGIYYLKTNVWLTSACDILRTIQPHRTCTIDTSWLGLNEVFSYLSSQLDFSLSLLLLSLAYIVLMLSLNLFGNLLGRFH